MEDKIKKLVGEYFIAEHIESIGVLPILYKLTGQTYNNYKINKA